ncbi:MAG: hypothetical protein PHE79_09635 [Eubacteriales bacterium]|nr:hypothetical protein [Eubacteriales bacterium]
MQDIFFRKDNYKGMPWYNELCIFCNIGVCKPEPDQIPDVQAALQKLGYQTRESNGYLIGA